MGGYRYETITITTLYKEKKKESGGGATCCCILTFGAIMYMIYGGETGKVVGGIYFGLFGLSVIIVIISCICCKRREPEPVPVPVPVLAPPPQQPAPAPQVLIIQQSMPSYNPPPQQVQYVNDPHQQPYPQYTGNRQPINTKAPEPTSISTKPDANAPPPYEQ